MKTKKSIFRALLGGLATVAMYACIVAALFGLFRLWVYNQPLRHENYRAAAESPVGDRVKAMYGLGLQFYQQGNLPYAKQVLSDALNELTAQTGIVPEDRRRIGSDIQHLLGVVNEHDKQFRLAIAAYEESLKLEPNNYASKYNLERLKQQYPDLGKNKPDPRDPSNGNGSNKKGI